VLGISKLNRKGSFVLNVDYFEIYTRQEVPVMWGTFSDPWGNRIGFFEYIDKTEETERITTILGKGLK
jgi:hypothetical protein